MPTFEVDVEGRTYDVDAPDPNTAWSYANAFHKEQGVKRQKAIEIDQAATQQQFQQDEAARPLGERVLTNLGAGFHTFGEGARQLAAKVGIGGGVGDEELTESRQRKQQLAGQTTGGGLIQLAGEALPTMVLPVGAAGSIGRVAAMGALGGGAAGAFQPVLESESRVGNIALGAAGGAAAPVVVRGATKMLPRALGGRGETQVSTRAGKRLVRALGGADEASDVATRLEAPRTGRLTKDIPMTAAEKAGSPELAGLEMAARKEPTMAPQFAALERAQNEGLYEAAKRAGREGTDLRVERLDKVRQGRTAPMREDVMEKAGKFSQMSQPLQAEVDVLRKATAAGSPGRKLADLVEANVKENASPEQLYELRKLLANKLNGPMMPGDEIAAAVKGAQKQTRQMMQAIDDRLNQAAQRKGGSATPFTDYLTEFQARSGPVESARAQQLISRELDQAGRPMVGQAPEVTRSVLKRAMEKHGVSRRFGTKLEPGAQGRYGEVMDVMQQMEEPTRTLKLAGTGGGGSQTAMQQAASIAKAGGRMVLGAKTGGVGNMALDAIVDKVTGATREEVAQMMLNPQRAAEGIRAALKAGQPLSASEKAFLLAARSGVAAPASGLLTAE